MTKIDEIAKLNELRKNGAITDGEYEKLKSSIVNNESAIDLRKNNVSDITGGAANKMVNLEWAKFVIGIVITIVILIVLFSKASGPGSVPSFFR